MRALSILIGAVLLLMVGCQDRYRYPCQDPENQTSQECNPPACVADGTCTDYLLKKPK